MYTISMFKRFNDCFNWRWYVDEGSIPYVSVTTVLGAMPHPKLVDWWKSCEKGTSESISRRAADKGSDIHEIIEQHYKGIRCTPGKEVILNRYLKLVDSLGAKPVLIEELLVHPWGFAGTCDLLMETSAGLEVWDIKTGKVSTDAGHQLGAYALMLSLKGYDIKQFRVIGIPANPLKEAKIYTIEHRDFVTRAFLHRFESFKAKYFNYLTKGIRDPSIENGLVYTWPIQLLTTDSFESYLKEGKNEI